MKARYELMEGEASINKPGGIHRVICCDCGLVHDIMVSYDPDQVQVCMIFFRDADATKEARRKYKRKKLGLWAEE